MKSTRVMALGLMLFVSACDRKNISGAEAKNDDASCEAAAAAMVPAEPQGENDKLTGYLMASCKELPWSAMERGCLATVAGDLAECEPIVGKPRLQAIVGDVRARMPDPRAPGPADLDPPAKDASAPPPPEQ